MAVKTTWEVNHSCGHEQVHDLSGKRVSERAGYAKWLGTKDCSDCFFSKRDATAGKDRETWLAERRAAELVEIETWETRSDMGPLDGSEKAVEWGRKVRFQLMAGAFESMGLSEDDFAIHVEAPARQVTRASWWIDQRDSDPEDLAELVADAATTGEAGINENPY